MRPLSVLLPASLLALASGAIAQTAPYPPALATPMSTVQVSAPSLIREDDARVIEGGYAMSNGWRLKVNTMNRHIEATVDRQKPLRLVAVAPFKFATPDGNVLMEFNRGATGDDMMMSYRPDPRVAHFVVISSMPIAQR